MPAEPWAQIAEPLKPAHFVVVPINCLFAIAIYKIAGYTSQSLGVDISSLAFVSVTIPFSISIFQLKGEQRQEVLGGEGA